MVINSQNPEQEIKLLTQDYLFKDLLAVETVRKPMLIEKLAKLLALQMGQKYHIENWREVRGE